ncbi:GNAT family N-acetyltransferase [uncultured Nostoc sp.]|uniref:GNAT family N-acetyltransferase n=1 Tax=uncultured Nostoc sp. TaxID=340711 RepID=UPI0035C9F25A
MAYRRQGVASKILEHIIKEAQRRGYDYLNLETRANASKLLLITTKVRNQRKNLSFRV